MRQRAVVTRLHSYHKLFRSLLKNRILEAVIGNQHVIAAARSKRKNDQSGRTDTSPGMDVKRDVQDETFWTHVFWKKCVICPTLI
jgi:hypothetical protein